MLTKRVLTEAEASLVKEIQKDEPTWDRAESVEVSILKPSWILLRHDHGPGGSLYPCNLWQFRFGSRYGLPLAASVQTTDELLPQITSARTCHDGDIVILVLNPTAGMKRRLKLTYCRATCTQRAVVPDLGKAWQSNRNATAKQSSLWMVCGLMRHSLE
jgi:hypothetical protein